MKQSLLIAGLLLCCCVTHAWAQALPQDLASDISRVGAHIEQAQQAVEDAAGRAGLQHLSGRAAAQWHKKLSASAHALESQYERLTGVFNDIERALARKGRHDLFERHQERTAELEQRLADIRDSLAPDNRENLSETGLPFGRVRLHSLLRG